MDRLSGAAFRRMIHVAYRHLSYRQAEVNALNVFPVPDGDTGTNMSLTLESACKRLEATPSDELGRVARAVADGSLMGARGNSGVILSQLFRGMARRLADLDSADPVELGSAFVEGVETAYRAVMKPTEGTILTVSRAFARGFAGAARAGDDLAGALRRGLEEGERTLARTPQMLPVLRQAGVVDAGGKGFLIIMAGALAALENADAQVLLPAPGPAADGAPGRPPQAVVPSFRITEEISDIRFVYDTELLVRGDGLDADAVQATLGQWGDSVLVIGDPGLLKVHIHTNTPGKVVDYCIGLGDVVEVEIKNMREQHAALRAGQAGREAPAGAAGAADTGRGGAVEEGGPPAAKKPAGIVAVAAGDGIREAMLSMGADAVVPGGQTMNPSTEELARACDAVAAHAVILLPNNKNVILAAEQVQTVVQKPVRVVPSRNVAEGMAALLAAVPGADLEANVQRMAAALGRVRAGEVTFAARDARWDGQPIRAGDPLGFADGKLVGVGGDRVDVLVQAVRETVAAANGAAEVLTVFTGADVPPGEVDRVRERLAAAFPDLETEIHAGGQPHQHFVFWVE